MEKPQDYKKNMENFAWKTLPGTNVVKCFMEMPYCGKSWKKPGKASGFYHNLRTIPGKVGKSVRLFHIRHYHKT